MIVYDDEHRAAALLGRSTMAALEARRCRRAGSSARPERSRRQRNPRTGSSCATTTLVPSPEDWKAIHAKARLPGPPRPTLITDFSSYNTDVLPHDRHVAHDGRPPLVSAALGRRPDSLLASSRCTRPLAACGSSSSKAGPPIVARSTWPQVGRLCSTTAGHLGRAGAHRDQPSGHLRAFVRQRRRPADPLGRRQAPVRRRAEISSRARGRAVRDRGRSRAGADGGDSGRRSKSTGWSSSETSTTRSSRLNATMRTSTGPLRPIRRRSSNCYPTPRDSRIARASPRPRLCARAGALPDAGRQQSLEPRRACMGAVRPVRSRVPATGLGHVRPIELGGSRIASDRQGVLRLLAASQAGLAADSIWGPISGSRFFRTSNGCDSFDENGRARSRRIWATARSPKAFVQTGIDSTEDRYRLTVTVPVLSFESCARSPRANDGRLLFELSAAAERKMVKAISSDRAEDLSQLS